MLVPSKFTRLEESTIFKMKCILANKRQDEAIIDVYERTKNIFYDVSEFIYALDVLYILDAIDINDETGKIKYA